MGTGHSVALGPEFWNCTHTCRTHGCDTRELPIPMLHPKPDLAIVISVRIFRSDHMEVG
jgi:hypothetical protein